MVNDTAPSTAGQRSNGISRAKISNSAMYIGKMSRKAGWKFNASARSNASYGLLPSASRLISSR